jgi:hypothetical protein
VLWSKQDVYAFARQLEGETLIVALNLSRETRNVSLPVKGVIENRTALRDVWGSNIFTIARGKLHDLKLAPRSGMVLAGAE